MAAQQPSRSPSFRPMTVGMVTLALALALALSSPAMAMVSLTGGRTLGLGGQQAARAEVGWPGVRVTWVLPMTETLDISPQLGLVYGHNMRADRVGFEPGAEVRWNFWQRGAWTLAATANPALLLWIPTDGDKGTLGLRLGGPGMVVGYQLTPRMTVTSGLRVPLRIEMTPEPVLVIPLLTDLGAEMEVMRRQDYSLQAHGKLTLGSELCVGSCDSATLSASLGFGVGVLW